MSTALVLGGGGPVGVAWEAGLLAGLAEGGAHLATADRIVGTSAGSIVGARLALGATPATLLEASQRALGTSVDAGAAAVSPDALMAIGVAMFEALSGARPPEEIVSELGKLALAAETMTEDEFLALVSAGELGEAWPDRDYRCTAFDIDTGDFTVWTADSGVPLDRAVASSCSVPGIFPPITIDGQRYMDGGVLSGTNAQLVTGADTVVVVSVMSRAIPAVEAHLRAPLDREVEALRAAGATVEVVEFDDVTVAAAGGNLMDFAISQKLAVTGHAQGRGEADRIAAAWG